MDFDFDDLLSSDAANTAKAGIKFQPKGKPKPKPKANVQPEPKSTPNPSTQSVEVAASTEEQTGKDVNQIIGNIIDSLQSSFEKSQEEKAESPLTLDSPSDCLPESTTVNLLPCSETPAHDDPMDGKLAAGPTEPDLIGNIDASTTLESIAELDPLTGEEGAIINDNRDFQIENISSGSKEAEDTLFWETDILAQSVTGSGPRVSKFKPKPKAHSRKLEQISNNPDQDVGPVQHGENIHAVPSQTNFIENEHASSSTPDEILGTSSVEITDPVPSETISVCHLNEESDSLAEISQMGSVNKTGRSSKRSKRLANKATLPVIDEAENEGIDDTNNNDDDFVLENESLAESLLKLKSMSKSKSKKPLDENKKPVRKRKKDKEVLDELTEVPKKKFSHSTTRTKRRVNPELLKIPEEEFELHMHNFSLRDLIRLREHKERIEKKEASVLATDATGDLAQNATYYNYQTHMKITPRMKWTKQDTEQFYQAIQQFGTDFSIITECFPGRTREQIRSKYKKECKQHRLRIDSAQSTRVKDHSHFEFVIERLKQARAEEYSENDDLAGLTGEEDEVQVAADNNEEGGLQKEEVKDMEADKSPPKVSDIEEDDTWSQYKSEI